MAVIKLSPLHEERPTIRLSPLLEQRVGEKRDVFPLDTAPTLEFVPSTEDRAPMIKFGTVGGLPWEEADAMASLVQLIVPKGFVVLDIDNSRDAEIALDIVKGRGLKCRVVKSRRGIHLYFRSNKSRWSAKQKIKSHIGLVADWRVGNKNSLITVKRGGEMYEVIQDIPVLETCELPAWLEPTGKDTPNFRGMRGGDGRNETLFTHIGRMEYMGVSAEDALEAVTIINEYVFDEPLDATEFASVTRPEAFQDKNDIAHELYFVDGKFQLDKLAVDLVERFHILTRNGRAFIYDKRIGHYRVNEKDIERLVIDVFPSCLERHRSEVVKYITALTTETNREFDPVGDERFVVNVKNGRLNLRTGALSEHTPLAMDFTQIPVEFDPDATCPELTEMLKKVFCGDKKLGMLFEEIVGYSLMRTSEFDSFFIFTGEGSNGKSTILRLIRALVGHSNSVSLSIQQLEDRFTPASLEDKLVNLGDDIGSTSIRDTGMLKKLTSGEDVQVERKGQDSFVMNPFCTLIYSANDIPHIGDNSAGMRRRMIILPFDHTFSRRDPDYDPAIERKILTPEGLSATLNLALRGAMRLIKNGCFTIPNKVELALENFYKSNSSLNDWAEDRDVNEEWLEGLTQAEVYKNYVAYCTEIGVRYPMSKAKFGRSMSRELGARKLSFRREKRVMTRYTLEK